MKVFFNKILLHSDATHCYCIILDLTVGIILAR